MTKYLPSILFFILFSVAAYYIRLSNTKNDDAIAAYLSGENSANFKSELREIGYYESLEILTNSIDLNAHLELTKKNSVYNFQFTSIYSKNKSWYLEFERKDKMLTLKSISGLKNYRDIIYCK